MADDEISAATALGQYVLGALAFVAVMAGVFWAIGAVRSDGEPAGEPTVATEPTAEDTASSDPADGGTPPAATTPPAPSPETTTPPATPTPTASVAPAEVSLQVLDAVLDDEGASASELAAQFRQDGYDVVAENRAVRRYEETTVFYTSGSEAAARQVAAQYGFEVVEPKPDNLTDSVDIHVVVGQDA